VRVNRWRPRWYELLPEVGLAAGLTFFLIDETDAATGAFGSAKALALMAGTAGGWVVARIAAARFVRWPAARLAGFTAAAAVVLAVVVVPAYDDDTVVETFPRTASSGERGPMPEKGEEAAPPGTVAPSGTPVALARGPLRGIDHRAEGTVVLYRADTGLVVGLEDFDIQPGPDYDVYLVPGADRDDLDDAVRVDDLRGNRGTQFYDVPAGLEVTPGAWTVLVWCETFGVPIASATPA
jgi:hypothetical protein